MSKTGATYGYSMLWVSIISGALVCGFIALFMRFGIYSDETFLGVTRRKLGRIFALLCGVSLASTDATFQFGNCLGVATGMSMLFAKVPQYVWPIAFTAAAIIFMFALKHIYRIVEKMMVSFLIIMLVAFSISLVSARPNLTQALKGALIPTIPKDIDWVTIGGLVATTFCLVTVVFQAYVVKAKGWRQKDLPSGITDTVMASVIVTLVGSVIMMTAAALLFTRGIKVENAEAMAFQLEYFFGGFGKIVFGIGFCAAAFSSFVTNSLIGGTFLNDGFNLGGKFDSTPTRIFATVVLLIGMVTSLLIITYKPQPAEAASQALSVAAAEPKTAVGSTTIPASRPDPKVIAIAVGQAATLLAVPFGAIATVVVLFDRRATGGRKLGLWAKALVLFGAAVLLFIAVVMYVKIKPAILQIFEGG